MRNAVVKELEDVARRDSKVFFLTGDLGYGVLDNLRDILGKRFINAGISEQNMASVAAGIAQNKDVTVYVYSIGNFVGMRCLEQIRNDICYPNANVKIIIVGGGFAYGQLGMTHHATEDLAIMRALPNMYVFSPGDAEDAVLSLRTIDRIDGPCYLRLEKGGEPRLNVKKRLDKTGLLSVLHEGEKGLIIGCGSVIADAYDAALKLESERISVSVVDCALLKPFPKTELSEYFKRFRWILSVEEHNVIGGIGDAVSDCISSMRGERPTQYKLGLNDEYTRTVGSRSYLRDIYGLSSEGIYDNVRMIVSEWKND